MPQTRQGLNVYSINNNKKNDSGRVEQIHNTTGANRQLPVSKPEHLRIFLTGLKSGLPSPQLGQGSVTNPARGWKLRQGWAIQRKFIYHTG